jgi:NADH-quinone oxidoreductase subunit C
MSAGSSAPRLAERIQSVFAAHILGAHQYRGQATVLLAREGLAAAAQWLRDDPAAKCEFLMDLTCVDYLKFGQTLHSAPRLATPSPLPYFMDAKPEPNPWERGVSNDEWRFELVYHFYSLTHNHRLRVKVPLTAADPTAPSLAGLWRSADWFEREVWDMFGIRFTGHPHLKRILMYEEFKGHALRKDYPIRRRQPLIGLPY